MLLSLSHSDAGHARRFERRIPDFLHREQPRTEPVALAENSKSE